MTSTEDGGFDSHDDDPAVGGHDHGNPFVWDPDDEPRAGDRHRGLVFIVVGALLIGCGAFLWWLATQ